MEKYTYKYSDLYGYPIHPKAIEFVTFEFFWDVLDENAPFGSDEGYEGFVYYWEWEDKNRETPLEICLFEFLSEYFSKENAKRMIELSFVPYESFLLEADNYMESKLYDHFLYLDQFTIAIGFGSFVKYGKVHPSFKEHMIYSLERAYKPKDIKWEKYNEAELLFERLRAIVEV